MLASRVTTHDVTVIEKSRGYLAFRRANGDVVGHFLRRGERVKLRNCPVCGGAGGFTVQEDFVPCGRCS